MKTPELNTLELAKDIIYLCRKNKYIVDNTKVQKLLYLFVGFCLINDVIEIYDLNDKPKLWPFGPVFPKIYKNYDKITKEYEQDAVKSLKNEKSIKILEQTVKKWGKVASNKLSAWSHLPGSPWDILVKIGVKWNTEIPLDDIKTYFKNNVENII